MTFANHVRHGRSARSAAEGVPAIHYLGARTPGAIAQSGSNNEAMDGRDGFRFTPARPAMTAQKEN
jgi:hypothetical protein